jgi:hypothetical protein
VRRLELHLVRLHQQSRHLRLLVEVRQIRLDDLRLDDLVHLGHQIRLDDLVHLDVVRQIHLDDLRLDDLVHLGVVPLDVAHQLRRRLDVVRHYRMKMDCYQLAVVAVLT